MHTQRKGASNTQVDVHEKGDPEVKKTWSKMWQELKEDIVQYQQFFGNVSRVRSQSPLLSDRCPEPLWTSPVSGAKPTPEHEDASASGVVPTELCLVSLLLVTKV